MAHVACYVSLLSQHKIKEHKKNVKEEKKVNGTINKKG